MPVQKCFSAERCSQISAATGRKMLEQSSDLRALVCKNQTNSILRGKGEKFDFFLILMLDRLDYN